MGAGLSGGALWGYGFAGFVVVTAVVVVTGLVCVPTVYQPVPQEKYGVFCDCFGQKSLIMRHVFLKSAMKYVAYLCNFMR